MTEGIPAKRCSKCGEYRPLTEFGKVKAAPDGLNWTCKSCNYSRDRAAPGFAQRRREAVRRADDKRRAWLWEQKSKPCTRCGGVFHPTAMQFDHLPGFKKEFTVGLQGGYPIARLEAEMAKCQLVCSNCHFIIGWERTTGNTVPLDWRP